MVELVRSPQLIVSHLGCLAGLRGLPVAVHPQPICLLYGFSAGIEPDPILVVMVRYGQAGKAKAGPTTGCFQQLVYLQKPPVKVLCILFGWPPALNPVVMVGFVVDLELCAMGLEGAHDRDHLVGKLLGRGVPACVDAVIVQAGDDLDVGVLPLDPFKHLWFGLTHHLDDFCIGFTDDLVVNVVKNLLISAVHADTASPGAHRLTPLCCCHSPAASRIAD